MSGSTGVWPSVIALTDEDRRATALDQIARVPAGGMLLIRRRHQAAAFNDAAAIAATAAERGIMISVSLSTPPKSLPVDAVHIPEHALKNWRRADLVRLNPSFVSASAHGWTGISKAAAVGVDAVLVSTVFATKSHPNHSALGLYRFAALVQASPIPVYALGGMTYDRSRRTTAVGAAGFAGIGLFTGAN
tara:strand:- start:39271 stop:39840 length:570 start_codon:yes stop_codon:yes gene_type:complete